MQIGTQELPSYTKDDSTTKHAFAFPFPNEFTLLMLPLQMRSIPTFLIKKRKDRCSRLDALLATTVGPRLIGPIGTEDLSPLS